MKCVVFGQKLPQFSYHRRERERKMEKVSQFHRLIFPAIWKLANKTKGEYLFGNEKATFISLPEVHVFLLPCSHFWTMLAVQLLWLFFTSFPKSCHYQPFSSAFRFSCNAILLMFNGINGLNFPLYIAFALDIL